MKKAAGSKLASVFMLVIVISTQISVLTAPVKAEAAPAPQIAICHTTGNSWNAQSVTQSALSGHLGHGDFVVDATHPCPPAPATCPEGQTGTPPNCVTPVPVDVCPNVTGNQSSGPCIDSLCLSPFAWDTNSQTCVPPPCPIGTTGVFPVCMPILPPSCPEGTVGIPPVCMPPMPEVCPEGFTGAPPACVPVPPPSCPVGEVGVPPLCMTPQNACTSGGQFWTGESCVAITMCTENQTYHSDTNSCTDNIVIPTCSENQTLDTETNTCVNNKVTTPTCAENQTLDVETNECVNNPVSETPAPTQPSSNPGNGDGGNGPIAGSLGQTSGPSGSTAIVPSTGNGQVLGASCSPLITSFIRFGKTNDVEDVKKLQAFLNKELGLTLEVSGSYDQETMTAVKAFQLKYEAEILAPWYSHGLSARTATGYVFKTTLRMINMLSCTGTVIPMPEL